MYEQEALHSWEQPAGEWEDEVVDWDADQEALEANLTPKEAAEKFAEALVEEWVNGRLTAKQVCTFAHWAALGGMTGPVVELALAPTSASGNFKKHLDKVLGCRVRRDSAMVIDVPGHRKSDLGRMVHKLPVCPPHESLHAEASNTAGFDGLLAKALRNGTLPPAYHTHPKVVEAPGQYHPLALYADG